MAGKTITLDMSRLPTISIGRLGATVPQAYDRTMMLMAALDMAERRILRLEMALRRAGIEVEHTELPT